MPDRPQSRVAILAPRSTIGRAVAAQLSAGSSALAYIGRDLSGFERANPGFERECPLTDFEAVADAVGAASEALGGLTGIVNCAGSMLLKPAHLTTREDFDETMAASVTTAFAAVRAAGKHLAKTGGSVVLISSAAATLGMPNHEAIGAAKGAVEGLARSAAASYANRGARFNIVAPGLVDTNLSQKIVSNDASRRVSESLHPLGRIGNAEEIARAICWLLDPAQSWVTGQVIGVDGGLSHVQPRPKIATAKS